SGILKNDAFHWLLGIKLPRPPIFALEVVTADPLHLPVGDPEAVTAIAALFAESQGLLANPELILLGEFQREAIVGIPGRLVTLDSGLEAHVDVGSGTRAAVDGSPSLSRVDGLRYAHLHEVAQEGQSIEEVALAGGVAAHEDRQRMKGHIAERDALVAANAD